MITVIGSRNGLNVGTVAFIWAELRHDGAQPDRSLGPSDQRGADTRLSLRTSLQRRRGKTR
jgi:hypothetical protein